MRQKNGHLKGSATISLIILVIIIGGVLLAGGIFPKKPQISSSPEEAIVDPSSLSPDEKNSLQLKTLKFKKCFGKITMSMLLDRSGSMGDRTPTGQTKISRLKEAVIALTNNLSDDSIIGIQSFSSISITEDVPISYYKDVSSILSSKVKSLSAGGQTPTHDALAFSYEKLETALPKFPDRKFNFIIISDGQPVPASQDPRLFNPNPADQIKALGVNVFALAVYDQKQAGNPALSDLLKTIASSPENYLQAESADDISRLLTSITEKICKSIN